MNVLPWLLDWPPRPAAIAAFLLLSAFTAGTLVAFGGVTDEITRENVTVEATDLTVSLNDEGEFPDAGTGTVQTCLASGTPGDRISVLGDVTVGIPTEGYRDAAERGELTVAVSLAHTAENTTMAVTRTGRTTSDVFWMFDDDETLSVGDTASVQVRVRAAGETVADAIHSVTVEDGLRSYDC